MLAGVLSHVHFFGMSWAARREEEGEEEQERKEEEEEGEKQASWSALERTDSFHSFL